MDYRETSGGSHGHDSNVCFSPDLCERYEPRGCSESSLGLRIRWWMILRHAAGCLVKVKDGRKWIIVETALI